MVNSVDPDQTAPLGAFWLESALFAYAIWSEILQNFRTFTLLLFGLNDIYSTLKMHTKKKKKLKKKKIKTSKYLQDFDGSI